MAESTQPRLAVVVLAGGEGRRMGGADKGLLPWRGRPLVDWMLERARDQQGVRVDALAISANRHLPEYAARGLPVLSDAPEHAGCGPLAGMARALAFAQAQGCELLWVLPCDAPHLPLDLLARLLAERQQSGAPAVLPALCTETAPPRWQPAHALLRTALAANLEQALAGGQRRVMEWLQGAGAVSLNLSAAAEGAAFANLNQPSDLG